MKTVSTAAGTIIKPTIAAIDRMLASPSDRYMFNLGDADRLLDARLELMAAERGPKATENP